MIHAIFVSLNILQGLDGYEIVRWMFMWIHQIHSDKSFFPSFLFLRYVPETYWLSHRSMDWIWFRRCWMDCRRGGTIAVPLISSFIQSILRPVWHLGRCYWWLSGNCFAKRYIWQQPTRLVFAIIPLISRYETWMVENNHAWYRWINTEALHVAIMMSLKVEGEY